MAVGHAHAVLLGDGRVLALGTGQSFDEVGDASASAELWDPASGAWRTTESLNSPRADFATVPLADGRVLVTGGRNTSDQSFSSTYVYDPRAGHETWSKVGLLHAARTSPSAAVLRDGRVLIAGGYFRTKPSFGLGPTPEIVLAAYRPGTLSSRPRLADVEPPNVGSALATAELFDPATGNWSTTGSMNFARFGAAAVTLADGRVLVVGSGGGGGGVSRVDARAFGSAEIFDPRTGRFGLSGRLPNINRSALQKQGVPRANPVPEEDPVVDNIGALVALKDGGAVLVAQAGSWKHQGEITRSFRFDAGAGTWTEIGQTYILVGEPTEVTLVTPGVPSLAGAMVAGLPDGRVLVVGGTGPSQPVLGDAGSIVGYSAYTSASAQLYDPATNTWSPLPPMPEARSGAVSLVLRDGSVLLAGGSNFRPPGEQISLTSAIRFVPSP